MLSHGAMPLDCPVVLGKGENVGLDGDCAGCGIELQGQASPRGTPLIAVREGGQIEASPFMSTFHSTGRGTMITLEAWVDGCERMWSDLRVSPVSTRLLDSLTEHIAGPAIFAEELFLLRQGSTQAQEELRPALETSHLAARP